MTTEADREDELSILRWRLSVEGDAVKRAGLRSRIRALAPQKPSSEPAEGEDDGPVMSGLLAAQTDPCDEDCPERMPDRWRAIDSLADILDPTQRK